MTDIFNLNGKTALITGASSGLGKQFAKTLASAGAKVILAARRTDLLEEIVKDIQAQGYQARAITLDVKDQKSVKEAIQFLTSQGEKIDILINNAGIAGFTPVFADKDAQVFEDIMNTNVLGIWYMTKEVATHMKEKKIEGSIINIASIYGMNKLETQQTAYCASKAAVIQMTKALVGELSPYNIRINCIAPGYVLTPMVPKWVEKKHEDKQISGTIPQNFLATPKDLDGLLLYLASNKASTYMTGSCITIDGGSSWGG
ncbi:MAG: SDR family oxidoreductase [Proteobacteria bacterium]|nr:SDR family oxidoreductase [Pseudomonadota bacterium]